MNRTHHIAHTLEKNIQDNLPFPETEFVLLDYNSNDGLEDFVKTKLLRHIESGKLKYFRTFTPQFFRRSHSRNLALRLATGDILCNIDADNYTGSTFAPYIQGRFQREAAIFLGVDKKNQPASTDVMGRICMKSSHFMDVRGYDERFVHYGFEDYDLMNRLENFVKDIITDASCCGNISRKYFRFHISFFSESMYFNNCLNKKIAIDAGGHIKNCPSMENEFGDHKEESLIKVAYDQAFQRIWSINKDKVDTCKDCQFRYICSDCRAYMKNPLDKPVKCGYNPYTNVWSQ